MFLIILMTLLSICTFSLSNFHFATTQDIHDGYVYSPFGQVALLHPFFVAPHFSLHDTMLCSGCQNQHCI